jgi:uncharacterized protein (TIGR03435 family)
MSKRSIRRQIYIPVFAVALLCAAANASAQGSPSPSTFTSKTANSEVKVPDYDVVSVKESKSAEYTMLSTYMPDGFRATNISLEVLIAYAYGIRQDLISGAPGWVSSTRFDLEAKVAGVDVDAFKKLSPEQLQAMLQSLLVDRFKLKIHLAIKVLPIYELVKEKGGFKIKEAQPSSPNFRGSGPGMFKEGAVTLQDLANGLSSSMQRTVLDKTGIAGKYDIDLKWNPGEGEAADVSADAGPTLFTALQEQLGLKLQPTKGPVETLVIDAVEKPSKN